MIIPLHLLFLSTTKGQSGLRIRSVLFLYLWKIVMAPKNGYTKKNKTGRTEIHAGTTEEPAKTDSKTENKVRFHIIFEVL